MICYDFYRMVNYLFCVLFNWYGNVSGDSSNDIILLVCYIVLFVYTISYILSGNIDWYKLIVQTFEFWYKLCNFVILFGSLYRWYQIKNYNFLKSIYGSTAIFGDSRV